ncbi:MAG: hypothetical protein ACKOAH_16490, partial [Pirellula sp.]
PKASATFLKLRFERYNAQDWTIRRKLFMLALLACKRILRGQTLSALVDWSLDGFVARMGGRFR